jgi:hypothetical protein
LKTTDGYNLEDGGPFFLDNGQEVLLDDWMETIDRRIKYLVIPLYEGEAMEVSGDGGFHHEISMNYEHEGLPTIVYTLFKHEPLEKLGKQYKSKMKEIEDISLVLGDMKLSMKEGEKLSKELTTQITDLEDLYKRSETSVGDIQNEMDIITIKLTDKTSEYSNLQDSIDNLDGAKKNETLAYLRKRDFLLSCLEAGGVNNWEWYGESLDQHGWKERYPDE